MTERERALEAGFQMGSVAAFLIATLAALLVTLDTALGLTAGGALLGEELLTGGFGFLAALTGFNAFRKLKLLRREFPSSST